MLYIVHIATFLSFGFVFHIPIICKMILLICSMKFKRRLSSTSNILRSYQIKLNSSFINKYTLHVPINYNKLHCLINSFFILWLFNIACTKKVFYLTTFSKRTSTFIDCCLFHIFGFILISTIPIVFIKNVF